MRQEWLSYTDNTSSHTMGSPDQSSAIVTHALPPPSQGNYADAQGFDKTSARHITPKLMDNQKEPING
jgi:hypothetical protein